MSNIALDYSQRISGSALRAAGIQYVIRYLGDPELWPKAMNQAEVDDLRANGIRIYLNYEQTADFMLGGTVAGMAFAREARRWATSLGFATDEPIIYSADFDVTGTQIDAVMSFLQGAATVDGGIKNVGVYGEYAVVKKAIDDGYIGWQANAWSQGYTDSRAFAWQGSQMNIAGVQCDKNTLNLNYLRNGQVMPNIPASIVQKWPSLASEFPPNGTYDDSNAGIWADAAARYAAENSDRILSAIQNIPGVSGLTLSAADIDALSTAVVHKLGALLAGA